MFRALEKRYVTTDEEGSVVLAEVLQSQIVESSALSDTVRSAASDVKLKTQAKFGYILLYKETEAIVPLRTPYNSSDLGQIVLALYL